MPISGMKVAIQGEPGSFSHEAAMKLIGDAIIVPQPLSADVFAALSSGSVDAAVIPIENSLAGSVLEHFDLLLMHDVLVERETLLRIRHNLIAKYGLRDRRYRPRVIPSSRACSVQTLPGRPSKDAVFSFLRYGGKREAAGRKK